MMKLIFIKQRIKFLVNSILFHDNYLQNLYFAFVKKINLAGKFQYKHNVSESPYI